MFDELLFPRRGRDELRPRLRTIVVTPDPDAGVIDFTPQEDDGSRFDGSVWPDPRSDGLLCSERVYYPMPTTDGT